MWFNISQQTRISRNEDYAISNPHFKAILLCCDIMNHILLLATAKQGFLAGDLICNQVLTFWDWLFWCQSTRNILKTKGSSHKEGPNCFKAWGLWLLWLTRFALCENNFSLTPEELNYCTAIYFWCPSKVSLKAYYVSHWTVIYLIDMTLVSADNNIVNYIQSWIYQVNLLQVLHLFY